MATTKRKTKSYSIGQLQKLKVSTLRGIAIKKGVKNVAKKTKAQLIKSIKPTKLSCTIAGHDMHSKKRTKRIAGARKLPKC